jgi:hypothetical protein
MKASTQSFFSTSNEKVPLSHSMAISGTDKLEVPTIYKAYFSGLCKGIPQQNMALYGTVPPF